MNLPRFSLTHRSIILAFIVVFSSSARSISQRCRDAKIPKLRFAMP